jgi:hypothetical protein
MVWMAPQVSQIWVRRIYLLLLDHRQQVVAHQVDLLPPLPQALHLLETARGVVDLPVLAEDRRLLHHLVDVLIDGQDAVEDLPRPLSAQRALVLDRVLVLLGLLLDLLDAPLDPRCLKLKVQMHSLM